MSGVAPPHARSGHDLPRWSIYIVILGLYLTLRGYHSLDGDQSYRIPLLLHQQDSSVYADDPFVRAFDCFNPHRGSLMALNLVTWPFGLSTGLFVVFVLTFSATCLGFDRLARVVWPELSPAVGLSAVGLLLTAKAGNIGTNHLFEAMVLDRLMAFALGWLALATTIAEPNRGCWRAMAAIAAATLIHPSLGVQLSLVLAASWVVWALLGQWMDVSLGSALRGTLGMGIAVLPGLAVNILPGSSLQGNMPAGAFWLLSVELQGPQHMLPHLWRMPQWLAWGCYLVLAALALSGLRSARSTDIPEGPSAGDLTTPWPAARLRLLAMLAVILIGLAFAWRVIEGYHSVSVTVFQPFRMATLARGIALVFVAGRLVVLWRRGDWLARLRAVLLAVAFIGDWLLVVVALAELAVSATELIRPRLPRSAKVRFIEPLVLLTMLAFGLNFLGHHDTEFGNRTLAATLAGGLVAGVLTRSNLRMRNFPVLHNRGKSWLVPALAVALAWIVPLAALLAAAVPLDHPASRYSLVHSLINRCRFAAVPADDIERLGLWCRDHTPRAARFIGPPGPKTFRLWARRSLAFNRAASPYHADGLADWFARFQEHVDFHGSPAEFVRSYVNDRHGFEARYQAMSDAARAALALRQGATHVIAAAPSIAEHTTAPSPGPLELLHIEGRYAVYRVNSELLAQRQR
jgi:hypothetical protein